MTAQGPSPRQTLSYLRNLFEGRGIQPKSKMGQSFLIDLNLLELLLRSAELAREDLVLEVGSGTGNLTARLAEQAGHVLAVELDEMTRDGLVLSPQTIAELDKTEARRGRWLVAALWIIAALLLWLVLGQH